MTGRYIVVIIGWSGVIVDDTDNSRGDLFLTEDSEWVDYSVGNISFQGRTTVRVDGSGHAVVRFEQGETVETFERELSEDIIENVRETISMYDPRNLESQREAVVPDEPRVQLEFSFEDGQGSTEFWLNERRKQTNLGAVVDLFESVADTVSDGNVSY